MNKLSNKTELKIGQIVYHRNIYDHKEPLKIVGLRENEVELEGDYSGGTYNVVQKQWLPINGTSRVYNHKYKRECRDAAQAIEELAKPIIDWNQSTELKAMGDLLHMVLVLTNDIELNPEY